MTRFARDIETEGTTFNFEAVLKRSKQVAGWDNFDEDQFEEVEEVTVKPKTTHILDRKDAIFYGAYLRRLFYKKSGGKNILTLTEHNVYADYDYVYTKENDSQNRNHSEMILSLLQLFDFVAVNNGDMVYGNYPQKVEVQDKTSVSKMIESAKNVLSRSTNNVFDASGIAYVQTDIFDYIKEEELFSKK